MPIFPTYGGVSTSISTPKTPDLPSDPAIKQLGQLGQETEKFGSVMGRVMEKRQALDDEAAAMQKYMQASSELDELVDAFQKPEIGRDAKATYAKAIEQKRTEWFKGLSGGAAARLDQHLAPKLLEYRRAAGKIEHKVHLDEYQATGVQANMRFAETASRITDYRDGKDTDEYRKLEQYYKTGVANGYYSAEEAEKATAQALIAGATSRVLKVSVSEDKQEIENLLKVYDREDIEHDTFLKHIGPDKRVELKRVLKSRVEHINNEEIRKKNQERIDTERMTADLSKSTEIMAEQKLRDPAKYGELTHDWLDLAGETKLIDGKDLNTWHERLEKVRRGGAGATGGFGNAELINRLSTSVYTTKTQADAIAVQQEVKEGIRRGEIPVGEGQPGTVWLNHLESLVRGSQDEQLTPAKELSMAKRRVDIALDIAGPMANAQLKAAAGSVREEAYALLDANAKAGYPRSSSEILEEKLDKWRARLVLPGRATAAERRRSMGLPLTQDTKVMSESTIKATSKALQDLKAAPPGQEGEAIRDAARQRLMDLKRLVDLETEINFYSGQQKQSSAATQEAKPPKPSGGGGPLQQPKKGQ